MAHGIRSFVLYALASCVWITALASSACADPPDPDNAFWSDAFELPGLPARFQAFAVTEYRGHIFVGGYSPQDTNGAVIEWEGTRWMRVPGDLNGTVLLLSTFDDELVAAGSFDRIGNLSARHVATWNGARWSALGTGLDSDPNSILAHDDELFVGGSFHTADGRLARSIARWNGARWDSLGSGTNGQVLSLAWHDGALIAGGDFTIAGGVHASYVARWNGSVWDSLPGSLPLEVHALTSSGGSLWAGILWGEWSPFPSVYEWSGSQWSPTVPALYGTVNRIFPFRDRVIAAGTEFPCPDCPTDIRYVELVQQWDGSTWAPLGGGTWGSYWLLSVARDLCEVDGRLTVVGRLSRAGRTAVNGIAQWDGTDWGFVGDPGAGVSDFPSRIEAVGDDIYLHTFIRLLRWNRASWDTMPFNSSTRMVQFEGQLVFGDHDVYRWDGSTVLPTAPSAMGIVEDVVVNEGSLFACFARGVSAPYYDGFAIAGSVGRWNGHGWDRLGEEFNGVVWTLTVHDGDLIATGQFSKIGSTGIKGIARWDGTTWRSVDLPMRAFPTAICEWNGSLVVGGDYSGSARSALWFWRGGKWDSLAVGLGIDALAVHRGRLLISGSVPGRVASWDGSHLSPLGDGLVGGAAVSLASDGRSLFVAGTFDSAGSKPSHHVGRWDAPTLPPPSPSTTLAPAAPNPTRGRTVFSYSLAAASAVRLSLYDISGRKLRTVVDAAQQPGPHFGVWDGLDDRGRRVRPGVYFARLEAGGVPRSQRVVRIE